MKELTIAATVENIGTVTDFVNEHLEALACPMKAQMQIDIAIDELFGNIAHLTFLFLLLESHLHMLFSLLHLLIPLLRTIS